MKCDTGESLDIQKEVQDFLQRDGLLSPWLRQKIWHDIPEDVQVEILEIMLKFGLQYPVSPPRSRSRSGQDETSQSSSDWNLIPSCMVFQGDTLQDDYANRIPSLMLAVDGAFFPHYLFQRSACFLAQHFQNIDLHWSFKAVQFACCPPSSTRTTRSLHGCHWVRSQRTDSGRALQRESRPQQDWPVLLRSDQLSTEDSTQVPAVCEAGSVPWIAGVLCVPV